jgi:hypothetical protein
VEEIVRYRQGDPARADQNRAATGETPQQPERPHYLHEGQILPGYASTPWADRLGFLIAELCSRLTGVPLLEVLPGGANGAIILTGDDDQAFLENYDRQLRMIGGLPITYFLHHLTGHTRETIARMPGNVTYGFHPDALDNPSDYDNLCERQCEVVRQIVPGPLRVVRNHGFLHNGYLGHLKVWEKLGLEMDVNYPGTDGTALNGSFLPLRVRRRDGTWSDHYTLLTAFGDGMIQPDVTGLTEREAVRRIGSVVRQIERDCPAALVFNLHPQNVAQTRKLHDAVLALAERPGWTAVGLIEFLDWVILRDRIRLCPFGEGHWRISTPHPTGKAVLRAWDGRAWRKHRLDSWARRPGREDPLKPTIANVVPFSARRSVAAAAAGARIYYFAGVGGTQEQSPSWTCRRNCGGSIRKPPSGTGSRRGSHGPRLAGAAAGPLPTA